jgi:cellobiose phosphorylase
MIGSRFAKLNHTLTASSSWERITPRTDGRGTRGLTGSGGWNYTAVTRWMLGVRLSFDGMIVDPCIPSRLEGVQGHRASGGGATFEITVKNPHGVQKGVVTTTLDGHDRARTDRGAAGGLGDIRSLS